MPKKIIGLFLISILALAPTWAAETLKIASVQMPVSTKIDENLDKILGYISQAAGQETDIVLFPETALSGFDRETIESLDWSALQDAEKKIAEAAKKNDINVLFGSATKREEGRPYNTAVMVDREGNEIHRYHKMVPESWFEPGDHLAYFEVDGIPCSAIICHDERYPELVRLPVMKGARVCFYISYEINSIEGAVRKIENYRAQLVARAAENRVFMIQSNGIGGIPGKKDSGIVLGHSRFVDPSGRILVEADPLEEAMIVREIDVSQADGRYAINSRNIEPLRRFWESGLAALESGLEEPIESTPETTLLTIGQLRGVPPKWEVEKNFQTFLDILPEASQKGVDVLITPECWLDGYAAPDKTSTPEKLREVAQDLDTSPYLARVAKEADERDMYICFGFTSLEHGCIYNTAALWDRDGKLVGVYHKTHLQTHDLQYSFGEALPVWDTEFGPVGTMICADRRWPETARTLRVKGAKLILNPTYGMCHLENEWWMRTRGYENQCYIAFTHPKVGFVVGPKGEIVGKGEGEEPALNVVEIDLSKAKDDNHIRDRRPELYEAITDVE
ncbi:MAG: hypothetical protein H6752_20270 [Candidatus Omnitrophica bacterium]|nr:hypothetical protein [Candidatus Omnitrophota bacterium]